MAPYIREYVGVANASDRGAIEERRRDEARGRRMTRIATVANIVQCFDVFEMLLGGSLLRQCAYKMEISQTSCHKLAALARQILRCPDVVWDGPSIPLHVGHATNIERDRKHKDVWLRRIEHARAHLRPCDVHRVDACKECKVEPLNFLQLRSSPRRNAAFEEHYL